ncbi:uncharacterized protein LOC143735484 [Siphateles boraxobius]|uniref:uncharacterized protein LOC143735484 n=1 Tax=Siphateles boraxobius TaxID=180520 RepID=UPI004062EB08
MFRDRLKIDSHNGSLTIKNIRKAYAGLYKQEIIRSSRSNISDFYIYIYDHLPFSVITRNRSSPSGSSDVQCRCSLVCSVLNEENYEDNNTYSCVIYNPTTHQTKHLNITQLCQLCKAQDQRSRFMMVIAVILALLAAIAVVGGLIYHRRCKKTWKIVKPHDEEMHNADPTVCADLLQSTDTAAADCCRVWGSRSCRLMLPDMSCCLR